MSDTIIQVENLSKKYIIGHQNQKSYNTLRDVLANSTHSFLKNIHNRKFKVHSSQKEEFWALKDVSFEIKQGDIIGIIGRNGAGKSTLLKVLSRITEPTSGRISIKGRVASLLEVGTGFHPELTGRENIYLNGAILGMSKAEITRKFDEIVDFAEVEKFLDTPVKHYSSGMYVRLAFGVAAHLEPEILIVDEVLAVGDSQFQKKCLGKMNKVASEGRTVLCVSHNMGTISELCNKIIYLVSGQVQELGDTNRVIANYLLLNTEKRSRLELYNDQFKIVCFTCITILNPDREETDEVDVRYPFFIKIDFSIRKPVKNVELSVRINSSNGTTVFTANQSDYNPDSMKTREVGNYSATLKIPEMFLMPGAYLVTICAHEPCLIGYDFYEHIISFTVIDLGTKLTKYKNESALMNGLVIAEFPWEEESVFRARHDKKISK